MNKLIIILISSLISSCGQELEEVGRSVVTLTFPKSNNSTSFKASSGAANGGGSVQAAFDGTQSLTNLNEINC